MTTQEKIQKLYIELQGANIKEFVSKKNGPLKLDYLSWGAAVDFFTKACHQLGMDWTYSHQFIDMGTRGSMCSTTITVIDPENGDTVEKTMSLQCMTASMQAAKDADVNIINKTNMRSLVKCMTLFGLGMELYLKDYSELDEVRTKTQVEQVKIDKTIKYKNRIKELLAKLKPTTDASEFAGYESIEDIKTLENIGRAITEMLHKGL